MAWVLRQFHIAGQGGERPVTNAVEAVQAALSSDLVEGEYISEFDPEAFNGIGFYRSTSDVSKALRFPTLEAALECWRTQSKTRPLRPDGKPNRPLTALSVSPVQVPD